MIRWSLILLDLFGVYGCSLHFTLTARGIVMMVVSWVVFLYLETSTFLIILALFAVLNSLYTKLNTEMKFSYSFPQNNEIS